MRQFEVWDAVRVAPRSNVLLFQLCVPTGLASRAHEALIVFSCEPWQKPSARDVRIVDYDS